MSRWSLVYYETASGRCPAREYLDGLVAEEAARVRFDLDLLEEFGTDLGAPHVKPVRDKLRELRTTGHMQHRIFYFAASGKRLVLVHAITKKTPKTPQKAIETAMRRMADYLRRED